MFVEDEQLPLQLKIEDKLRASVKIHPAINLLQFIWVEVNFSVSLYLKGEGEFKIVYGFNERKTFIVKFKRYTFNSIKRINIYEKSWKVKS